MNSAAALAERDGFAGCNDVWRYILVDTCAPLGHGVRAYMRELMHERAAAQNGIVIHHNLSCQLCGVG